jgi:hypothetical protein
MRLNRCVISGNVSTDYTGGGLFNLGGTVTLNQCTLSGNIARFGGGVDNSSYGNASTATLAVYDSLVIGNTATGNGAGILSLDAGYPNSSVILTVTRSIVAGNVADGTLRDWGAGCGGGIASGVQVGSALARVTIQDTTVSRNVATGMGTELMGNGGGVLITAGEATLINSSISGNQATGSDTGDGSSGFGGGVWVSAALAPGSVTLVNTTVSSNTALAGGGGLAAWTYTCSPTAAFQNTIIADNDAPEGAGCYNEGGTLISLGYNLEDGDTCNLDRPTDLPDTDPLLGPLQDNGGPTWTHALPEASPAVDAGSCPGFTADQRGYTRPKDHPNLPNIDDACDMGAYEVQEDTIGPEITATVPISGAVNVSLDAPVVITFNEPMSIPTVIYSSDPDPGGWEAAWNVPGKAVTLSHNALLAGTVYTVTVQEAEDEAGNHLVGAPYGWSFTTAAAGLELYLPVLFR